MTNSQLFEKWDKFLRVCCNCHADENGNRPCDNGFVCDFCMTEEMKKMWENFKEDKNVEVLF